MLCFVCSVGNIPLAAVLWSGGISFAGVLAFIFADLIVLPIMAIYRKYYGWAFTIRISLLMFVTMVPPRSRWTRSSRSAESSRRARGRRGATSSGRSQLDYKLVLNVRGTAVFVALFWLGGRGDQHAHHHVSVAAAPE